MFIIPGQIWQQVDQDQIHKDHITMEWLTSPEPSS